MKKLNRYLLGSVFSVLPFAAHAADLPARAPQYQPVIPQPVPFTWTGFYVGGSAGLISQTSKGTDYDGMLDEAGSVYNESNTGGIFGLNAGYNYQTGWWVFGVETDISYSTASASFTNSDPSSVSSKLTGLGTVRGRIGYAFDRALFYGTGGFAYGNVNNSASYRGDPNYSVSNSSWQTGWTAGFGLEYSLTNVWTVRAEVLYVDLGSQTYTSPSGCRFGFKNTYTIGRAGLNYKF